MHTTTKPTTFQAALRTRTDFAKDGNHCGLVCGHLDRHGFKKLSDGNFGDWGLRGSVYAGKKTQALVIHGGFLGEYTDLQFGQFTPGDFTLLP